MTLVIDRRTVVADRNHCRARRKLIVVFDRPPLISIPIGHALFELLNFVIGDAASDDRHLEPSSDVLLNFAAELGEVLREDAARYVKCFAHD